MNIAGIQKFTAFGLRNAATQALPNACDRLIRITLSLSQQSQSLRHDVLACCVTTDGHAVIYKGVLRFIQMD